MTLDPVVLFFLLGVLARVARSDLRLPEALYDALSIFLLPAIGLKGGVELARSPAAGLLPMVAAALALSAMLPLLAYPVLRAAVRLARPDAAAVAAHYGSVSVVTFAVATSALLRAQIPYEPQMVVMMALMEAPGIVVGIVLAKLHDVRSIRWRTLGHEVVFGKAVYLLLGGLAIGFVAGPEGIRPIAPLFTDLFKGVLALFLLEMGLVAGGRLGELRRAGLPLVTFAVLAPLGFAWIGVGAAMLLGLSLGGTALLATLCASASYIAAPTALRIAVPEANPAL